MRAAILARKSNDDKRNQLNKLSGVESCKVQIENGRAVAAELGVTVVEDYVWSFEDVQGDDMGRPLDMVIQVAKAGRFDVLIMRDMDRAAREAVRQTAFAVQLGDAGARVFEYIEDTPGRRRGYYKLGGLDGGFAMIRGIVAEEEKRKRGPLVREAHDKRLRDNRAVGRAPYGYERFVDPVTRKPDWRPVPDRVAVVIRVAETWLALQSFRGAAVALNKAGVPSPTGKAWKGRGVRDIVLDEFYRGWVVWGRVQHVSERGQRVRRRAPASNVRRFPRPDLAIFSPDLIARLEAQLAKPRAGGTGRATPKHLLSSFGRCGVCGATLVHKAGGYVCDRRRMSGEAACPGVGRRNERAVDAAVLAKLAPMIDGDVARRTLASIEKRLDALASVEGRTAERRRIEKAIAQAEAEGERLATAIALPDGNIPAIVALAAKRAKEVETLRAELERLSATPPASLEKRRILAHARARLAELAEARGKGGVAARPVLEAILGGRRMVAREVQIDGERRWQLTARIPRGWLWAEVVTTYAIS